MRCKTSVMPCLAAAIGVVDLLTITETTVPFAQSVQLDRDRRWRPRSGAGFGARWVVEAVDTVERERNRAFDRGGGLGRPNRNPDLRVGQPHEAPEVPQCVGLGVQLEPQDVPWRCDRNGPRVPTALVCPLRADDDLPAESTRRLGGGQEVAGTLRLCGPRRRRARHRSGDETSSDQRESEPHDGIKTDGSAARRGDI